MQKKLAYRVLVVLIALGLAILNCAWLFPKKREEVKVFAASSLTDVLQEAAREFEVENTGVKILFNFAASGALQTQIEQGAEVDIFASAGNKQMHALMDERFITPDAIHDLAGNQMVVIARKDSSFNFSSPQDMLRAKQIAIGYPNSVPAGKYGSEILRSQGIWDQAKDKLVYATNVRQVLQFVEAGKAELGIVYATDVRSSNKVKVLYTVPLKMHTGINFPIGTLSNSKHAKVANQFIDWLLSPEGRELFEEYGFSVED